MKKYLIWRRVSNKLLTGGGKADLPSKSFIISKNKNSYIGSKMHFSMSLKNHNKN
jgi:hypothetical protein